jgi:hypothetical protein
LLLLLLLLLNYCLGLIFTIQLQYKESLTIELSIPCKISHLVVLQDGFDDVDDT